MLVEDDFVSDTEFDDTLAEATRLSLLDYTNGGPSTSTSRAGPSTITTKPPPAHSEKHLKDELSRLEKEIFDTQMKLQSLQSQRERVLKRLQDHKRQVAAAEEEARERGQPTVNYMEDFEWTAALKATMKRVFGIDEFRLCQQGVCNANMDGRDIICVMPTGGGKSLTYQLPAIMSQGCTIVISPLISLMADQVHHMHEAGVDAVMIMSSTTKEQKWDIYRRFDDMTRGIGKDIKLCYVTPERMAKDKTFVSKLQKLSEGNKLVRVVIDEAHCISQMGHDYRPDYRKLSTLRQLFPGVPIQALSATCPPAVREDILSILKLRPLAHGTAAKPNRTVYFSSPLYRKNLHYTILPKPAAKAAVLKTITDYILNNHANESGIIYCFTVKESEDVAAGIREQSKGKIKTGVYNAKVDDAQRMRLHERWRKGEVQVVCATIAFGLGIDKGNVRFVIHHSMSKSLDGFYQESGRAGRDGLDADCVLYYRHQDAFRIREVTCAEPGSETKLCEMVRFALDLEQCRKIHFAKYFSMSANLNVASWTTNDEDAMAPCGHCDNCTRAPESVDHRDVTVEAWKILKVAEYVRRNKGRVTLNQLADLARGAGKGEFGLSGRGHKGGSGKANVDLEELCGGPVKLSKEYAETLAMKLYLDGYFDEDIQQTAYSVNIYLKPKAKANDFTRLSLASVEGGAGARVLCDFLGKAKRASGKQRKEATDSDSEFEAGPSHPKPKPKPKASRKRKVNVVADSSEDESDEDFTEALRKEDAIPVDDDSEDEDDWAVNLSATTRAAKRRRTNGAAKSLKQTTLPALRKFSTAHDVIELSSD